jgi:hypothetical protein
LLHVSPKAETASYVANRLRFSGAQREEFERDARSLISGTTSNLKNLDEYDARELSITRDLLLIQIEYGNGFYRRQALRELRGVRPEVHQLTATLQKLLTHPDFETRRLAAEIVNEDEGIVIVTPRQHCGVFARLRTRRMLRN